MAPTSKRGSAALVILDMISEFRFEDAAALLGPARRAASAIARLRGRARAAGVPVIYVNDTAGQWESDPQAFIERCADESSPGHEIVQTVRPEASEYFIFKPRHSAFFETPFHTLLQRLRIQRLILTGITSHQCVLFTAMDAHVREYRLTVPSDCIAASKREETRHALFLLDRALNAKVISSAALRFSHAKS